MKERLLIKHRDVVQTQEMKTCEEASLYPSLAVVFPRFSRIWAFDLIQ